MPESAKTGSSKRVDAFASAAALDRRGWSACSRRWPVTRRPSNASTTRPPRSSSASACACWPTATMPRTSCRIRRALAQGRAIRCRDRQPDFVAGDDRAQQGDRSPAQRWRGAQRGADRVGRTSATPAPVRSRSPNTQAMCAAGPVPATPRSTAPHAHPHRLLRWRDVRRTRATHRHARRHGEKLDPTRPPPTPHVPRSMNSDDDKLRDDADDGNDVSAAEYVLGTMDATQRATSPNASRASPCSREIAAWGEHLSPMLDEVVPVVPPMHLWHRVRARAGIPVTDPLPAGTGRQRLWDRPGVLARRGLRGTGGHGGLRHRAHRHAPPRPHSGGAALGPAPPRAPGRDDGRRQGARPSWPPSTTMPAPSCSCRAGSQAGTGPGAASVGAPADGVPHSLGVGGDAPLQAMKVPAALREGISAAGCNRRIAGGLDGSAGGSPTGRPPASSRAAGR